MWVQARANMASCEGQYGFTYRVVMGLELQAVSVWVTKHFDLHVTLDC